MVKRVSRRALVRARWIALIFAALGIIPLELVIPSLAVLWHHQFLIFSGLTLYFWIYVFSLTLSLRVLASGDSRNLRELRITRHRFGQVGKMFYEAIRWARSNSYRKNWTFSLKALYYVLLTILGTLPFFIKFGIALCVLRPKTLPFLCLCLGTAIRAWLLVYLGADVFEWLSQTF